MFFRKRREKKAQARREANEKKYAQVENQFSAAIEDARLLEDPVKRIIALQGIKTGVDNQFRKEAGDIAIQASGLGDALGGLGGVGTMGCCIAGMFVAPLVMFPA